MPTPRETILAALHARLSALPATALRGEVLPERVPAEGLLILRDGEPGEPEVTLSPLRYHYQHRAEIEAVVQGPGRDATFDTLCGSIGAALAADRTLGGLCDWVEAEAPRPVDLPIDGAASLKAAVIPVVLHYSLSDPLGAAAPAEPDAPAPPPEPLPENLIPEAEATFDTAGAWSAAGSWSIAVGVASHAATALAENLEYDVAIPEGWVLVSYRILESNLQNGINFQLGGGFYNVNEARSRIGVHDRDLDVDERTARHVQQHEMRVAQLATLPGAAGQPHFDPDDLVRQEPARNIRVMDERVVERHFRGVEPLGHGRVAVHRMVHQRRADRSAIDHRLQPAIVGIEATHEADLHQATSEGYFGRHDLEGRCFGRHHRLLAEDGLADGDALQQLLLVRRAP